MSTSQSRLEIVPQNQRTRFLASVTTVREALRCLNAGVDLIDCKDPATGALGALSHETVKEICRAVAGRVPVSATIGEQHRTPQERAAAVVKMVSTGVPIIKISFSNKTNLLSEIDAVADARRKTPQLTELTLVGVLFAEHMPDLTALASLKRAGFAGVMLDTGDKSSGALPDKLSGAELARFVSAAKNTDLFVGLAGSLHLAHIPPLLALNPDILGFRGGICAKRNRTFGLDEEALAAVRRAIPVKRSAARGGQCAKKRQVTA